MSHCCFFQWFLIKTREANKACRSSTEVTLSGGLQLKINQPVSKSALLGYTDHRVHCPSEDYGVRSVIAELSSVTSDRLIFGSWWVFFTFRTVHAGLLPIKQQEGDVYCDLLQRERLTDLIIWERAANMMTETSLRWRLSPECHFFCDYLNQTI